MKMKPTFIMTGWQSPSEYKATHQSELKKKKKNQNLNENENTTYHVQNAAKLLLRGKFTDIHETKFPHKGGREGEDIRQMEKRESIVPEAKGKRCFKK